MGRKPRIEYQGAIYHVIQRGNNQEPIFQKKSDKMFLLEELQEYKRIMGFKLFGYVVMDNHYHLALQTMDSPLQKIMHRLNNRYSKYYNATKDRKGSVFQGRYRALPVTDEKYLLGLLRYIHQNPVKAGVCQKVDDYPWSSHMFYHSYDDSFVDVGLVLGMMSTNKKDALEEYKIFMNQPVKKDEAKKTFEGKAIIGEDIKNCFKPKSTAKTDARKSLDEILKDTGLSSEEFALIKQGSRKRSLAPYKKAYAKRARDDKYTLKEIGGNIQLSDTAVYKILEENK